MSRMSLRLTGGDKNHGEEVVFDCAQESGPPPKLVILRERVPGQLAGWGRQRRMTSLGAPRGDLDGPPATRAPEAKSH